uniref:non-specific serine/threonine protein kinase n=1 Tax=Planotaenium ohtanii TaxID=592037 RepID=A0A059UF92_9VIRI|nr:phototropin [Planotaenium ohtanii]
MSTLKDALSSGTTHADVRGGGSVPTARRYSLKIEQTPAGGSGASKVLSSKSELKDALSAFQQTFVMADGTKPDFPIMFASEGFYQMTGYTPLETIGKNCRFLQGPETDRAEVKKLKEALDQGRSFCGRILNYKKDGTKFWNLLTISPVKDDNGKVVKFIGMLTEVTKYTEGAHSADVRSNQLPISLIKYDARQKEEAESSVTELLEAAKGPHPLLAPLGPGSVSAGGGGMEKLMQLPKVDEGGAEDDVAAKPSRKSGLFNMLSKKERQSMSAAPAKKKEEDDDDMIDDESKKKARRGLDLATTLERIQKNFVITDPRLPENPIIFASDDFLELTEYSREEIIGRNCRFLQGKDTDEKTVQKIRDAIKNEEDITVQLLNYTKSGKPFWNLFHLQAVRDNKGVLQYFIGVQLDASQYVDPSIHGLDATVAKEGEQLIIEAANSVEGAVKELADPGNSSQDLWEIHSRPAVAKPHKMQDESWKFIKQVIEREGKLGLKHFKPIKPLGCGDTGSVHLVELRDTGKMFAMKAMDKEVMINRNKVHRACTEREILGMIDFPFLPTLYASFQTATHVCLITEFCSGGELYGVLEKQKGKRFTEEVAKFFTAEVLLALQYLHCHGIVYRDLKPENILLTGDGHAILTDFDLSFLTQSATPQVLMPPPEASSGKKKKKKKGSADSEPRPKFVSEPNATSNSFVGTEEYIAPEIISGAGHSAPVDWWALGIFIYEVLYGKTPFRGRNRQRTFTNVLMKELNFAENPPVSANAKSIIRALLERDPAKRLGSARGATEIMDHPWFSDINFPLIKNRKLPPLSVAVKSISSEPDSARQSVADEELEWDENDGRPSISSDYGY